MKHENHQTEVCVIGGGMAGIAAALATARHGASVVLMHDRPVLGGNTSSEIRIHICGADRHNTIPNMRETGILEELRLENLRRNPNQNYSIWDLVLYDKVFHQEGVTPILNCTCQKAEMQKNEIVSVTGWQLTSETYHTVRAKIFIDCSGDGILAPLTGAAYRIGREARSEFGESIGPEVADKKTMGMTCMFHAKKHDAPQKFEPPAWAYSFPNDSDLPYGLDGHLWLEMGYWWVELGGERDGIHDTERIRDELLKVVMGVWDHIKNQGDHGAENWALDWIGFLPGKRESRRYEGEHILTQRDIEAGGKFDDVAAYGGWTMDDHHPAGFWAVKERKPATIFHPAPSPYGIPYRSLYSRNIENLMFAGRNASCTHAAMSSTRVSGTACVMGQAVGSAAALAMKENISIRDVGRKYIHKLQQTLLQDDCYLPGISREMSPLNREAKISSVSGNAEAVRDGVTRPIGENIHAWNCPVGGWITYDLGKPETVQTVTLVLDSGFDEQVFLSRHGDFGQRTSPPDVMPKKFRLEGLADGKWDLLMQIEGNYQRLVVLPIHRKVQAVRFTLEEIWGGSESRIYGFYID